MKSCNENQGEEKMSSRFRTWASAFAVLSVAAGLICAAGCAPGTDSESRTEIPRNVRVINLVPTDVDEYFEISGPVEPVRGATVSAEENGRVFAVPHDKGAAVEPGDILIELDRRLLKAEMTAARARGDLQQFNAERVVKLFEAGKVSEYEKVSAEASRDEAVSAALAAELRYDRAAIAAPFCGIVADRYVEPGELVAAGAAVARVIDPFTLKMVGTASEREVAWIDEGAAAAVTLDGVAEPLPGRVGWVGFEADAVNGKFKVEIHLDNPELALRSGVVGRARIHKLTHRGVVAVPRDAVMAGAGVSQVYVVEGDRASRRDIVLGSDQGLMVIVESGLSAGEQLVVRGQRELIDGALVRITERTEAVDGTLPTDPAEVTEAASGVRSDLLEEAR